MNIDQHIKVAQWHLEQARLHNEGDHVCGCPVNAQYHHSIDEVEAMLRGEGSIKAENTCSVD